MKLIRNASSMLSCHLPVGALRKRVNLTCRRRRRDPGDREKNYIGDDEDGRVIKGEAGGDDDRHWAG